MQWGITKNLNLALCRLVMEPMVMVEGVRGTPVGVCNDVPQDNSRSWDSRFEGKRLIPFLHGLHCGHDRRIFRPHDPSCTCARWRWMV
jgi:hypothetical protein